MAGHGGEALVAELFCERRDAELRQILQHAPNEPLGIGAAVRKHRRDTAQRKRVFAGAAHLKPELCERVARFFKRGHFRGRHPKDHRDQERLRGNRCFGFAL